MKTIITTALFLLLNFTNNSTKEITFSIPENFKIEATFSIDTASDNSVHLILANDKKTRQNTVLTYVFNDEKVTALKPLFFKKETSVLDCFYNKNTHTVTFLFNRTEDKDQILQVYDLDLETNTYASSKKYLKEGFKTSIKSNNKLNLFFASKDEVKTISIANHNDITATTYSGISKEFQKELRNNAIDGINQDEFVFNGSISDYQLYQFENSLYFVNKSNELLVTKFPLSATQKQKIETHQYDSRLNEKVKNTSIFVKEGKLFTMLVNKKEALINVFDLEAKAKLKSYNLLNTNPLEKGADFTSMKEFIKQASKGANAPTITVNTTKNNNFIIRTDYVIRANYSYNWWGFQMMMFQHQQHMNGVMNSVGPNIEDNDPFFTSKKKHHHFEFLVSADLKNSNQKNNDLVFPKVNKKEVIEKLTEEKANKHVSICFFNKKARSLIYNKKTKKFTLKDFNVDDSI